MQITVRFHMWSLVVGGACTWSTAIAAYVTKRVVSLTRHHT